MVRFKFFSGDVDWKSYGGKFISKRLNNGEFDYWLVLDVMNLVDAVGEREATATYQVSLESVSVSEAGEGNLAQAFQCCGGDAEDIATTTEEQKIDALLSYGVYATLWNETGNNIHKLLKEGRNQAQISEIFYGFMTDRQANAIGNTGWDFQRGQIGFTKRTTEEDE